MSQSIRKSGNENGSTYIESTQKINRINGILFIIKTQFLLTAFTPISSMNYVTALDNFNIHIISNIIGALNDIH